VALTVVNMSRWSGLAVDEGIAVWLPRHPSKWKSKDTADHSSCRVNLTLPRPHISPSAKLSLISLTLINIRAH
jgi:hypothetical protein